MNATCNLTVTFDGVRRVELRIHGLCKLKLRRIGLRCQLSAVLEHCAAQETNRLLVIRAVSCQKRFDLI